MRWIGYGPEAVLFTTEPGDCSPPQLCADLEEHPPADFREATPAYQTVLVEFIPGTALARRAQELIQRWATLKRTAAPSSRLVEIPVRYEGEDLEEWSRYAGLSATEAIARHSAPEYAVALLGFAPGFPYLEGLDPALHMPRRTTPRPRIPAGSVAIGGSHTGIYSIPSPGGWNIIGHTDARLFAPEKETQAFLLRPGDRVKFLPVET